MKRSIAVNELIGLQINDGSGDFEILSYDSAKNLFLVNELSYNEDTCEYEKTDKRYFMTKKEMEIALHHFDGINHTIIL